MSRGRMPMTWTAKLASRKNASTAPGLGAFQLLFLWDCGRAVSSARLPMLLRARRLSAARWFFAMPDSVIKLARHQIETLLGATRQLAEGQR